MSRTKLKPIHPGEVLLEEFIKPFNLTEMVLSEQIGVTANKIIDVTAGRSGINADLALRLGKFFGTSAQFWLGLQSDYDIDIAREKLGDALEKEIVPIAA